MTECPRVTRGDFNGLERGVYSLPSLVVSLFIRFSTSSRVPSYFFITLDVAYQRDTLDEIVDAYGSVLRHFTGRNSP